MLPNTTTPAVTQGSHATVLRQPVIYIAVPAQQKSNLAHVCSNPVQPGSGAGNQKNGPAEARTVQVCTCPPEVHKGETLRLNFEPSASHFFCLEGDR